MEFDAADPQRMEGADERADPVFAAADAASKALRDAQTAARAAVAVTVASQEATKAAAAVAVAAKLVMTGAVAAKASSTGETAARAAAAVDLEAISQAIEVAEAAVAALVTIASKTHQQADEGCTTTTADTMAATVAAAVMAQEKATAEAAATVESATAAAAQTAAGSAEAAAATVDLATDQAAKSRHAVARVSAESERASEVALGSTRLASQLVALARTSAMQRSDGELRQATVVAELREATLGDELRLYYQPMYNLQTGAIVAVEALLRWQHPSRGLLMPQEFLDVAQGRSLMNTIGDWVLTTAVAQAAAWRRGIGDNAPVMWVNISVEQLGRQHLTGVIEQLFTASGLERGKLGLEVTERQLIGSADAVAADLCTLRDQGVLLAVDDFGTGYASLDYLRRFSFDEIKVDRAFVSGLGLDRTDTAVTSSIIALGRALDLSVVAEGVETQDQHDHLRDLGCAFAQGYLFQRPAPAEIIDALLSTEAAPPPMG